MRQSRKQISLLVLGLLLVLFCQSARAGDTVFQYSTIDALLAGLYDGKMSIQDIKYQGDFGLGTLNGINGELVILEGQAYNVAPGGAAAIPADSSLLPFGAVTFFEQDTTLNLGAISSMDALNRAVVDQLPSKNLFYAIRIDGTFSKMKARAIAKQQPPYAPLAEVVKKQVVVELSGKGTLVGFYSPKFVKGVGVPGFHWHFLTENRQQGGHVLDCAFAPTVAMVDTLHNFTVRLPADKVYDELDLTGDKTKELHAVEKDPGHKQ